ncbi:hypothetical protein Taro_047802 [Colocasia esculenta]|uniref:Uncharacterized protein n=1 Tax=Colocasia esculenta TaxID=4460 RepID=A0A843X4D1_COLES|nr:hypothetical protein [Colocasia esculenta]
MAIATLGHWPRPQGRDGEARRDRVVWRHTWLSRSGRDGGGRRILIVVSGGVATTFLTDLTAVPSVRTVLSGVRYYSVDATWSADAFLFLDLRGLTAFGVASWAAVATCSLSRRADPSCLEAHRFKTEGSPLSDGFLECLRCSWWEVMLRSCRRRDRGGWSEEEVRLLSSGRAHAGRRRRGGSRGPRS